MTKTTVIRRMPAEGHCKTTSVSEHLSRQRLLEILSGFARLRIGVVGDMGLDAYWHADMTLSHLSRETPLFPRPIVREAYSPGAGANVAANLVQLGINGAVVLSVLGKDWRGEILHRVMAERGIEVTQLLTSSRRSTTTFIKPILHGHTGHQEDARIDFENSQSLAADLEERLIARVTHQLPELDALIIADQLDVHGIITPRVREALNAWAGESGRSVFVVDSRRHIGLFRNMVLKPNKAEAATAVNSGRDPRNLRLDEILTIGTALSEQTDSPVFITLSEAGALLYAHDVQMHLEAAPVRAPLDPVGAGDSFCAALAASLAAGATLSEAGTIANLAAAVVVEKLGTTGTASPEEILERYAMAESEVLPSTP
jgi:D-glycero-beta-D-manno-heptose-7-phosphate kinase